MTGYRNKCELSIGRGFDAAKENTVNDDSTDGNADVECGFVVRMDAKSGEQLIASADSVPNIPVEFKVIARYLKGIVKDSGLPYYRRTHLENGAEGDNGMVGGFWRLCMCRMVDTDPKRPILLLLQTTSLPKGDNGEGSDDITQ